MYWKCQYCASLRNYRSEVYALLYTREFVSAVSFTDIGDVEEMIYTLLLVLVLAHNFFAWQKEVLNAVWEENDQFANTTRAKLNISREYAQVRMFMT